MSMTDKLISLSSSMTTTMTAAIVVGIPVLFLSIISFLLPKSCVSCNNRKEHAVITGGSSGIGLAMARHCLERGVKKVTLIARNADKLLLVQKELQQEYPHQTIVSLSANVTNYTELKEKLERLVQQEGPPTLLINNAGASYSGTFLDTPISEFESLMQLNYFGTIYVTKTLLPYMTSGSGICLISSMAGQLGVYGYSAYSPTKAALILLGQTLFAELKPLGISVTLAYPPDTDTPGFKEEQISKPVETQLISEGGGLFQPTKVANKIVQQVVKDNPPFGVCFGLEGWMLGTLTAGMGPVPTLVAAVNQVCLMGILRFVSLFYLWDHERIVKRCFDEKKKKKA